MHRRAKGSTGMVHILNTSFPGSGDFAKELMLTADVDYVTPTNSSS